MSKMIHNFNTLSEIEAYRKEINEACDKRAKYINVCTRANELSNKSFGVIKEAFEAIAPELFRTNEGKTILNKYSKLISTNHNLSALHSLYENIRKAGKSSDAEYFTSTITDVDWNVDKKTLSEDCRRLGRILAEGYIYLGGVNESLLPKENVKLDSAVQFIGTNRKTVKNIAEYSNAVKVIKENIASKETDGVDINESVDIDALANSLIRDFNEKYSNSSEFESVNLVKEIYSASNKEVVFGKYKDNCINAINEATSQFEQNGDSESCKKLKNIMEQINKKIYSSETLVDDVCNFINIAKVVALS